MNFHIHAICHNILQTKKLRKRSEKYKDNNKKSQKGNNINNRE